MSAIQGKVVAITSASTRAYRSIMQTDVCIV